MSSWSVQEYTKHRRRCFKERTEYAIPINAKHQVVGGKLL